MRDAVGAPWFMTHTHVSLVPGTPAPSYGNRPRRWTGRVETFADTVLPPGGVIWTTPFGCFGRLPVTLPVILRAVASVQHNALTLAVRPTGSPGP